MAPSLSDLPLTPPPALSPSSIETWRQCPLKFKYTRIDGLEDPPGVEAVIGSFVHEILEHLYLLPFADRNISTAQHLARTLWRDTWRDQAAPFFRSEQEERQLRWQAWWCVENLFGMETPSEISLDGVEHKFTGLIGDVPIRGIIDRWSHADGGFVIGDYKTGKTPRPQYQRNKFFQLMIYACVMSDLLNESPARLELLYLKNGDKLTMIPNAQLQDEVVATVTQVHQQVLASCETGDFPAVPSRLCDWCSFKKTICPQWNGDTNEQ